MRKYSLLLLTWIATGCAGNPEPGDAQATGTTVQQQRDQQQQQQQQEKKLVPPGYGTLHQDEFTMQLRSDQLLVKVTPLAETVIRTAAPDTYNRLHRLAEARRAEAERKAGTEEIALFQVSFYSYQPNVAYQPENLQLLHQGRQLRAAAIIPLTTNFGRQQLQQQAQETAVYVFTGTFDYDLPISARYELVQNDSWTQILQKLEVERTKILSRAGSK